MKNVSAFTIPVPSPFSWKECLSFLSRSANECLFTVRGYALMKAFRGSSDVLLVKITHRENELLVDLLKGKASAADIKYIEQYISGWFDLQTDLSPFYKIAANDQLLQPLVKQFHGLRLIGIPDLFEALSWAIIGQQINLTFAYTLKRRLVETFGETIVYDAAEYRIFPSAEIVSGLGVDDLRALQFSGKKAEYLIGVAQKFASGELGRENLLALKSSEQQEKYLTSIRGIGKWTAHYVMMKSLNDHSAFPVADVGLQNAIKARLGLKVKPAEKEIYQMGAKWKGWEAYATFYLWRSLY